METNGSTAPLDDAATIRLVGHSCFLIQSPQGVRVLIDPYDNSPDMEPWFLKPVNQILTDVLVVTHEHFDHSAAHRIVAVHGVMERPGDETFDDVRVQTFADLHSPRGGNRDVVNRVVLVETGGMRFCHLGDNRADVPREIVEACQAPDVLAIPIDDTAHTLSFDEIDRIVDAFDPQVIVPMHHRQEAISAPTSPLGGIERWLERQVEVREVAGEVAVDGSHVADDRAVWILDPVRGP